MIRTTVWRRFTQGVLMATVIGAVTGCSPAIPVPTPAELQVKQIGYGPIGAVEVRWRLVLRMDAYLLDYDDDRSGAPYRGAGLRLLQWSGGCAALDDGGVKSSALSALEAGAQDGGSDLSTDAAAPDSGSDLGTDAAAPDSGSDLGIDAAAPDSGSDLGSPDLGPPDLRSPDLGPTRPADSPIRIPASWCLNLEEHSSDAGAVPVQTPGKGPGVRLHGLLAGRTYYFAVRAERNGQASALSDEASILVAARK